MIKRSTFHVIGALTVIFLSGVRSEEFLTKRFKIDYNRPLLVKNAAKVNKKLTKKLSKTVEFHQTKGGFPSLPIDSAGASIGSIGEAAIQAKLKRQEIRDKTKLMKNEKGTKSPTATKSPIMKKEKDDKATIGPKASKAPKEAKETKAPVATKTPVATKAPTARVRHLRYKY